MTATTRTRSIRGLRSRLNKAGFQKPFVDGVLFPEWWSPECDGNPGLLQSLEFEVARFLRLPIDVVQDPSRSLVVPESWAKLRSPKSAQPEKLSSAIHAGAAVARAVVRNLKEVGPYRLLPTDPMEFRSELLAQGRAWVDLRGVIRAFWAHGIPVISVENLPTPKFKAMACFVENRPVIVLGHRCKDHPSNLVNAVHEGGHIAFGHVDSNSATVDVEEDQTDQQHEKEAWAYANTLLTGNSNADGFNVRDPRDGQEVWKAVVAYGTTHGIDPSLLVHWWARVDTRRMPTRKYVLKTLGEDEGAIGLIQSTLVAHLDLEDVAESDANLLRSVLPQGL